MSSIVPVGRVADALTDEVEQAMRNPRDVFGYATFGMLWPTLNYLTAGLQERSNVIVASRPKVGKSKFIMGFLETWAEQALLEGKMLRVVTLETKMRTYLRGAAAIKARIADPMNIRRGRLSDDERSRYDYALQWYRNLPIEFLANETDLSEKDALILGNSSVDYAQIADFVGRDDTFLWVLDHIGLVANLSGANGVTGGLFDLSNKFLGLCHEWATGVIVTHLTRESVGGGMPSIEGIAGSDQVGRNADQIYLLWRPFFESRTVTEEDHALIESFGGEPALLRYYSRDEGSGHMWVLWSSLYAHFTEQHAIPENLPIPGSEKKQGKKR